MVAERTRAHPLQPFSRRYFEPGTPLFTYAREWRAAHVDTTYVDTAAGAAQGEQAAAEAAGGAVRPARGEPAAPALPPFLPDPAVPLTISALAAFLRNPVKVFFRERLGVVYEDADEALPDEEAFGFDGLEEHGLVDELAGAVLAELASLKPGELPAFALETAVEAHLLRIQRAGRLPIGGLGLRARAALGEAVLPLLRAWRLARASHPLDAERRSLRFEHAGALMEDWLDHRVRADAHELPLWLAHDPGRLLEDADKGTLRPWRLLQPWVRSLLAAAADCPSGGLLVGRDASVHIVPTDPAVARALLARLIEAWIAGLGEPLPVAARSALALVGGGKPAEAYEGSEHRRGEVEEASLARCYPDYATLTEDGRFGHLARELYAPLLDWIESHAEAIPHPASAPLEPAR